MSDEEVIENREIIIARQQREKNIATCKHCGNSILWLRIALEKPTKSKYFGYKAFELNGQVLHNMQCRPKVKTWRYK